MTGIGERVRKAREARGLSQGQLAAAITPRVTQQAIGELEAGRTRTSKHLHKIADVLGVSVLWLETGDEATALPLPQSRTVEAPAWAQSPANLPRDIPVRGTAMGGAGEMFDLNGEAIDWVRRPPSLAGNKDVFGFYHVGTSMEPWRREGDLSLVSQKRPPRIGDHVLIELVPQRPGDTHGPALVKRLVARTGPKIRLAQYNPAKELEIDAAQVRHVFRIFEWQELVGL